jgi:hypothetical protein
LNEPAEVLRVAREAFQHRDARRWLATPCSASRKAACGAAQPSCRSSTRGSALDSDRPAAPPKLLPGWQ